MFRSSRFSRYLASAVLLVVVDTVFFTLAAPGSTQESCPKYDEQERVWLNNQEVELFVDFPDPACGPAGPTDKQPDADTYLIAPIDAKAPQGLGGTFPLPDGGSITVPVHDLTVERNIPASQPADCFGSYVLSGSNATSDTVLTREDPNGSGLNLAYAIKLGGVFRPLTAKGIIRAGVAQGLLSLNSSIGYGGTCWIDSSN